MATVTENESEMKVKDINMSDIYSDSNFNVRGEIRVSDVVELAKNIKTNGLLQPITIQPFDKIPGYKYRIVVGHRRFAAYQYLEGTTIPAIIKEGLSEIEALILNFTENVNRKDLNMVEEAHGIKRFLYDFNLTFQETARRINKGQGWVQIRAALLKLPPEVQQDAAAGMLTQAQVRDLASIKDPDRIFETVKKIKEARIRGESRLPKVKEKKKDPTKMKRRGPEEIYEMIDHILDEFGDTNVATRALAWANGEINDLDFYRDLREFAKLLNISYCPPKDIKKLLDA